MRFLDIRPADVTVWPASNACQKCAKKRGRVLRSEPVPDRVLRRGDARRKRNTIGFTPVLARGLA